MAGAGRVYEEAGSSSQQEVVHERTSLLGSNNNTSYDRPHISPDGTIIDEDSEETEIDPNEFDNLLSRAESITTGLGIEVESQETAMLRGPRRYSFGNGSSRAIPESPSEEYIESKPKSPFLAGVSVSTFWLIFGGVMTGNFVACFDSTIMVSSHPVITSYFQSSNSASWLSTAFLLTSTSFQPLFGRLSDTIGRKTPYIFTMTIFLIATIWCALAQSMTSFIIARAVCGLGAGGMMAMGSIIMSDLVPIEIRGVYQSYINIVFGVGSTMGAALGGAIADSLGWRWEFGVQVPLMALCVLGSYFVIPRKLGLAEGIEKKTLWEAMKVFDFKGSLLLTVSITFLILGLVSLPRLHSITSLTTTEPRWQHLPMDAPLRPRIPHHLLSRLPPLHLHRIHRPPTHHAPKAHPAQPARRAHPRELHRRHHRQRRNIQHPALLPSRFARERHHLRSSSHCAVPGSFGRRNSDGVPDYVDEEAEVVACAGCYLSGYGDDGTVVYAEGITGLGVPVLPGSFCDGSRVPVPGCLYECPCCV